MDLSKPGRKRQRRYCEHCDNERSHAQYFDHKKRYCKNGVWEKKSNNRQCIRDDASDLPSSHDLTGEMHSQSFDVLEQTGLEEVQECDSSHKADDEGIHLFLDSSDSDEEANTFLDEYEAVTFSSLLTMARRGFGTPKTPQPGRGLGDRNTPASPTVDNKMLLTAITGLSRQLSEFAADISRDFKEINERLQSIEDRLTECESNGCSTEELKRKRRLHNPKISEAVRRLHNSVANCRRYDPEQGLSSPYNEMVTSFLLGALSISPELRDEGLDKNDFVVACKTYYETVRRNFRYSQPELASVAAANKTSARSRQRRKRLLEARQSVLAADEVDFWRGITADMMSDEEDGAVDGVSGWIVRPPSFRSQELSNLCAKLQTRLEASSKYVALHHRRLRTGLPSNRRPPHTYDPEAAKRHLTTNVMP
ncbi:hypothetical protein KOW79_010148 [Hemibagrus wyckioides]|uniref:Uncharacterized protein n=2 Tax=Hemibagrus wyckioides TaxID=337641 RepID=A0A9D3NTP5_9TELE|nr:hypothetical protein KOW79_010148 [Hemibagrus wyckioides]